MAKGEKTGFSLNKKLKDYNIPPFVRGIVHVALAFLGLLVFAMPVFWLAAQLFFFTSPLWVLFLLKKTIMFYWVHYVQHQFVESERVNGVLLEIKLPREITHSPRAMELVYDALHIKPQYATPFQVKWRGHLKIWYSIEIVSNRKGELRMYIWCWKRFVDEVKAAFYAQYPTIQIVEAPSDYARDYFNEKGANSRNINCWGMAYKLDLPDVYPIRTYFDYELEKDPKVEHKHDPLVTALEQLSAHEPYEEFWLQIMFQPEPSDGWKKTAMKEIKAIYDSSKKPYTDASGKKQAGYAQLKPMQFEIVRAMERSTMKNGFMVSIRGLYITEGPYNSHNSQTLSRLFVPIGAGTKGYFNLITLDTEKHTSGFDYPWEFWFGARHARVKRLWEAWIARSAFAPPHIEDAFMLTSEELATVFHIPGEEAKALGIKRINSLQKSAPPNLPI